MRSLDRWQQSLAKTKQERLDKKKARSERLAAMRKERLRKKLNAKARQKTLKKRVEKLTEYLETGKKPPRPGRKKGPAKDEAPISPRRQLQGRPRRPDGGWYGTAKRERQEVTPIETQGQEEGQEAQEVVLEKYGERGITTYTTTDGLPVMFLHYSACERKDPMTPRGAEWREHESRAYPGGIEGPRWLQEMEIRFDVRDTNRVWPNFDDMRPWVSCPDFDIRQYEHWPIIVGYDYGYLEPTAIVVLALASEHEIYQIDEIYVKETSIADQAAFLKMKPYFHRITEFYGDPNIWARTQHQGTITTSMGQIWQDEHDIQFARGQNFIGSDAAFIHLLNGVLWKRSVEHGTIFKIFESCKNTLRELRTLAWRENDSENPNLPTRETIASKNVHAFDALKYALLERYQGKAIAELPPPPGSVDWYIEEMTRVKDEVRYVLTP